MATSSLTSGLLSAGIALCSAGLGFAAVHHYTSHAAAGFPGVSISPTTLSLGHLGQYASVDRVVRLSNPNDFPVQIRSVAPSCGCTTAQFPDIIPPHSVVPLSVHFNVLSRSGPIQEEVDVSLVGRSTEDFSIPITGTVTRELALSQPVISLFGKPLVTGSLTIARLDGKPLSVTGLTSPAVLRTKASSLSASSVRVTAVQNGPDLAGAHREEITLHLNDPLVPTLTIPASWTTTGSYQSVPAAINFGSVEPGTALERKIQISGPNAAGLHIVSAPPGWEVNLHLVRPGTVALTLNGSSKGGLLHSSVILATGNASEPNIAIPVYAVFETSADVCSVKSSAPSSH